MVCLGNICINTLHKGAEDDDDDDDDDNNTILIIVIHFIFKCITLKSGHNFGQHTRA
jgi:hypothetical protein